MTLRKKILLLTLISLGLLISPSAFSGDPPAVSGNPTLPPGGTPIGGGAPLGSGLGLVDGRGLAYGAKRLYTMHNIDIDKLD